jgi:hypothetical protein
VTWSPTQGVELLVFPELYLTGYDIGPAKLQEAAVAKVGRHIFVRLALRRVLLMPFVHMLRARPSWRSWRR